jgi:hypothetical protein
MAAFTLTKIDGRPVGTLGASFEPETDPSWSWYTAGAIASDADTCALTGWHGIVPREVVARTTTTTESLSIQYAVSGSTLTLTAYTDGAITAGAVVGIRV